MFHPAGHYAPRPIEQITVIHRRPSPTVDAYLRAPLMQLGVVIRYVDVAAPQVAPEEALAPGTFVVVARYIDRRWSRLIAASGRGLCGVAYLMDDDVPGAWRDRTLPIDYRWRLRSFYVRMRGALERVVSEIWSPSAALAARYPGITMKQVLPSPPPRPSPGVSADVAPARIFYHGSISHRADQIWLRSAIDATLRRRPGVEFEIVGNRQVAKAYRGLADVQVMAPLAWPAYRARMAGARFDIGLAPLLPTPFNLTRSYVKLFDITNAGAAGVFADRPPYAGVIRHGETGLLCPDSPAAWTAAIERLIDDDALRHRIRSSAARLCATLAEAALDGSALAGLRARLGR